MKWMASLASFLSPIPLAIAATVVVAGATVYGVIAFRRQPKDKELRRRLIVNQLGRLGDATITDVQDGILYYSYSVRGVTYTASQDISQLLDLIPENPHRLIGLPASLKYAPQNPANSIIVCEEWSGLRDGRPAQSA